MHIFSSAIFSIWKKSKEKKHVCNQDEKQFAGQAIASVLPEKLSIIEKKKIKNKIYQCLRTHEYIYFKCWQKKEILLLPYQVSTNKQKHKQWINLNMIFLQGKNKLCGKGWLKQWFDFKNIYVGKKEEKKKVK